MRRAVVILGVLVSVGVLVAGWALFGGGDSDQAGEQTASTTPAPSAAASTTSPSASLPPTASSQPSASTQATPTSPPAPSQRPAPDVADLLAAVNAQGDVVLVDPDTGDTARTLVSHDAGGPATNVAWDAKRQVVFFGRGGACASVWRQQISSEAVHRVAAGHHPAVSPDGTMLAIADGCDAGRPSDGITIFDLQTGAPTHAVPTAEAVDPRFRGPWNVDDIDWRPDGNGVVVTLGRQGVDRQHIVDVRRPLASVARSPLLRMTTSERGLTLGEIEHVGDSIVVAASCCVGGTSASSPRILLRDAKTGSLRLLSQVRARSLTADGKGRLRYLDAVKPTGVVELWALDSLDAVPRRVGGAFVAIAW